MRDRPALGLGAPWGRDMPLTHRPTRLSHREVCNDPRESFNAGEPRSDAP
jgi:hypothetical protein